MKHLLGFLSLVLLVGISFMSCSDQQIPTTVNNDSVSFLSKVTVVVDSFDYNLDWDPPYENCATGEDMQNHGWVRVYNESVTTPSGNTTLKGWVDYQILGGVTLENLGNGDIWTNTIGHNPFHEVSKENGFYVLSYHWSELYKMDNQTLHIHLKGHFKILPDGTITHVRESYTCR